jgi:hypothetical protein
MPAWGPVEEGADGVFDVAGAFFGVGDDKRLAAP